MNEALRNVALIVWAMCAMNSNSYAQGKDVSIGEEAVQEQPIVIYGASKKSPTESDEVLVEQNPNEPNPFGAPIVDDSDAAVTPSIPQPVPSVANPTNVTAGANLKGVVNQLSEQNPAISSENSPEKMNSEIQDTLYEAGDRIYDLQSYPASDVNTITAPNVDNEVTNYPSY